MKISIASLALLAIPFVSASPILEARQNEGGNGGIQDIISGLNNAGLTALATLLQSAQGSVDIPTSNITILGPNNQAIEQLGDGIASNQDLLKQLVSYHVVQGIIKPDQIPSNGSFIGETVLKFNPQSNILPGNTSQVVPLTRTPQNTIEIIQPAGTANIVNSSEVGSTAHIYSLDKALSPPTNTSATLEALNASTILKTAEILPRFPAWIDNQAPITFFVPNDSAVQSAEGDFTGLTRTQQRIVFGNHIVNGSAIYSNNLTSGNHETLSGQQLKVEDNNGEFTVTSGNATAKIIRSDQITSNGVIHVLDKVLLNTEGQNFHIPETSAPSGGNSTSSAGESSAASSASASA